jgi:phosphinothricin acetyltransferase
MVHIRSASAKDIKNITEIYNEAIRKTVATFDTEEKSLKEQIKWFNNHGDKYPIVVAEQNGNVLGFASLSQYSTKCAYSNTAEISLYVLEKYQNMGIGKKLMERILFEGAKSGLHSAIARITDENDISVKLHEKFGFRHVGIYREVGNKFNRLLDVILMQKIFK